MLTAGGDRTAHVWKTVLQCKYCRVCQSSKGVLSDGTTPAIAAGGSSEDDLDEKLVGAGPVEPEGKLELLASY